MDSDEIKAAKVLQKGYGFWIGQPELLKATLPHEVANSLQAAHIAQRGVA